MSDDGYIDDLIERSSLGEPNAKLVRARTPAHLTAEILARVQARARISRSIRTYQASETRTAHRTTPLVKDILMAKQIIAISVSNSPATRHHHIVAVQLADHTWQERTYVADQIDARRESYFVHVDNATAYVATEVYHGVKYIRTHADWTGKDNLLSLPQYKAAR